MSITRCEDQDGIEVRQGQTKAIQTVVQTKPNAVDVHGDDAHRENHLALWLGAVDESVKLFARACTDQLPKMMHDKEVVAGLTTLKRISESAIADLAPFIEKYRADEGYGRAITKALGKTLFPWHSQATASAYGTLVTLQGLHIYLANTQGHLVALVPTSQALWDREFSAAVHAIQEKMARCAAWVSHQIVVRAPQTLIVPSKHEWEDVVKSEEKAEGRQEEEKDGAGR